MSDIMTIQSQASAETFAPPLAAGRVSDAEIEYLGLPLAFEDPLGEDSERIISPRERAELLGFAALRLEINEPITEPRRSNIIRRLGGLMVVGAQTGLSSLKDRFEHAGPRRKRLIRIGSAVAGLVALGVAVRNGLPRVHLTSNGHPNVPGDASIVNLYQGRKDDKPRGKDQYQHDPVFA
jgi:hypothetical protein